jgi:hypothetical protein
MATSENEDVLEICIEAAKLEAQRLLAAAKAGPLDEESVRKLGSIQRSTAYVQRIEIDLLAKVDYERLGEKAQIALGRNAERMERAAAELKAARLAPAGKARKR